MKNLITYDITKEYIAVHNKFLGVSHKIINVITKNIVFSILIKSKYHIPIEKEQNIITTSIAILINVEMIPIPLAYQQTNAKIGESNVMPHHINIEFTGLKLYIPLYI